jgi:hypothetical protein
MQYLIQNETSGLYWFEHKENSGIETGWTRHRIKATPVTKERAYSLNKPKARLVRYYENEILYTPSRRSIKIC